MEHRFEIGENQINTVEYSWETALDQKSYVRCVFEPKWRIPEENSQHHFLMRRPFGFTSQRDGQTAIIQMEHPDWRISPAMDAMFEGDISGIFGNEFVPYLTLKPASAFIAEGSSVKMNS